MLRIDECAACANGRRGGSYDLSCAECRAEWEALRPRPRYAFWWHGGGSYGHAPATEVEPAASLEEVRAAVQRRYNGADAYRPCVDETSGAWIYALRGARTAGELAAYLDSGDPYPDFVTEFGPRGGCRVTPA